MTVKSYRELLAWQRAMELAVEVYRLTRCFPKEERYGLTSQARRAAVSIASNIAEGQGRGAGQEFAYHLRVAQGSVQEMETQLIVAERLQFISAEALACVLQQADETGRLIRGLRKALDVQLTTNN